MRLKERGEAEEKGGDVMIVEFELPPVNAVLLQSILQGEDGLATIRCFDPDKRRQQFWTTRDQLGDLHSWITSMPASMGVKITGEWLWQSGDEQ